MLARYSPRSRSPEPGPVYWRALTVRVVDALRRRGMRRQEVRRARIDVGGAGAEHRVQPHRGEEALRAVGIEAGARGDADADAVGLELLRAREACQRDLGFRQRQRAEVRIGEQVVGDAADQRGLPRLVLADRGVARDHMRHLVRQHRGELGGVVGERDQPARHVELAGRQREGVDRRRVQDGDLVFQVRPLGGGDQLVDGLGQQRLELRALVGAAIGGRGCAGARAGSPGPSPPAWATAAARRAGCRR